MSALEEYNNRLEKCSVCGKSARLGDMAVTDHTDRYFICGGCYNKQKADPDKSESVSLDITVVINGIYCGKNCPYFFRWPGGEDDDWYQCRLFDSYLGRISERPKYVRCIMCRGVVGTKLRSILTMRTMRTPCDRPNISNGPSREPGNQ